VVTIPAEPDRNLPLRIDFDRPLAGRAPEILDKLEQPPIWRDRAEEMERARAGVLVGTGVACAAKDYGTGADSSLGSLRGRTTRPRRGAGDVHFRRRENLAGLH
jgi:CO/xanthine dehydrogenase Mo-binding subunit